jgi:hypothetical protein
VSRCHSLGGHLLRARYPEKQMPYITCTKKKSCPKVSIEVCARCRVKNCPDYQAYCQPTLFPGLVQDRSLKRSPKSIRTIPLPLSEGPQQLSFILTI